MATANADKKSWRDLMPVHPAADMFPMLDDADLVALGNDIKANGLANPIMVYSDDIDGKPVLIDGRNRLAALERVGVSLRLEEPTPKPWRRGAPVYRYYTLVTEPKIYCGVYPSGMLLSNVSDDPVAYIASANIHRRHLTQETKRALIAQLLKETPERSDRATAGLVKVDHKTVAAVRRDQEQLGSIPQLAKRTGKDGKTRPANRRAHAGEKVGALQSAPQQGRGKEAAPIGMTVTISEEWRKPLADTEKYLGVPEAEYIDLLLQLGMAALNRKFHKGLTNQIELWLVDMHGKYPDTFNAGSWEGSCGPLSIDKLYAKHGRSPSAEPALEGARK